MRWESYPFLEMFLAAWSFALFLCGGFLYPKYTISSSSDEALAWLYECISLQVGIVVVAQYTAFGRVGLPMWNKWALPSPPSAGQCQRPSEVLFPGKDKLRCDGRALYGFYCSLAMILLPSFLFECRFLSAIPAVPQFVFVLSALSTAVPGSSGDFYVFLLSFVCCALMCLENWPIFSFHLWIRVT